MKYANLHLHSNHSDAMFTPEQLILLGKSLGYHALALTDHETDSGVKDFVHHAIAEGGIQAISGVEFYGVIDGENIHLTALDYDMDNPAFRAFVKNRVDLQCEKNRKLVEYGIRIGVIEGITFDDVIAANPDGAWLCIDSVMNAYRQKKMLPPSNLRSDVFRSEYAKSVAVPCPTAEEVIKVVRGASGIVAIAHPYKKTHLIPKLVEFGLNGVEISHPDNYENTSYLAEEMAKAYNLYRSGGTDHTGVMSGCGGKHATSALQGISEEEFYILKERRLG